MCCRTSVDVLQIGAEEITLVLGVAGFVPQSEVYWRRDLGQGRHITASINEDSSGLVGVAFALAPTIGGHSAMEHHVAAPAAAVLFKVAQTLAERGNGRIRQLSLLGRCLGEAKGQALLLAQYPHEPLSWESLCRGFKDEFLLGVPQLNE